MAPLERVSNGKKAWVTPYVPEVHGEMLFDDGTVAEIVVQSHSGVVDEDVERRDLVHGRLDLRRTGHVQGQGRDPSVWVIQGLACAGIDPPRPSPQSFLDQRLPDAAIGPRHEDRSVFDGHDTLLIHADRRVPTPGASELSMM